MKGTVVVTGGNGFIGSHVIERLVGLDYDVLSIDPRRKGNLWIKSHNVEYENNPVQQTPLAGWLMTTDHVTHIIHLGAWSNVRESMNEPYRMYDDTTMSTAYIIDSIMKAGDKSKVKSLVFASSSAVEAPESHYGVAKAASEMMLDVFREQMEGNVSVSKQVNEMEMSSGPDFPSVERVVSPE